MGRQPRITRRPLAAPETGLRQSAGMAQEAQSSLFGSLAGAARELRGRLQPQLDEMARNQAAEDVVSAAEAREDGRTVVNTPVRTLLTQQDQVYNQTLRAGIAATAKNDFTAEARRLEREYEFDPEGYNEAARQFMEGYQENADLDAGMSLELEFEAQELFGNLGSQIESRRRTLDTREQQQALELRLEFLNGEMATLIQQQGPGAVFDSTYGKFQQETLDVVNTLIDNPAFGWSEERGAEAIDGLANQMQELAEIHEMESLYYRATAEGGGIIAAMNYIDTAVNRMHLDQGERIGAKSRMQGHLSWLQQKTRLEEAARADQQAALDAQAEVIVQQYEAGLLQRMGQGARPSQGDIDVMASFVSAGWMKPERMNSYVNAATSRTPNQSDELMMAALFDYARMPGVTRDVVELVTIDAMNAGTMSASDRQRVLEEHDTFNNDRMRAGTNLLEGFFATGFMDVDTGAVRSAKARAESELSHWFRSNPDATVVQIEQKARNLAVEAGRRMPKPPMPVIPGYSNPSIINMENVDDWALRAKAAAGRQLVNDPEEFTRTMRLINEQVQWQREQGRLAQETVINVEE